MVRGDVHQIKMPGKRGHVQEGRRFAVIVQADDLLALSTSSAPTGFVEVMISNNELLKGP